MPRAVRIQHSHFLAKAQMFARCMHVLCQGCTFSNSSKMPAKDTEGTSRSLFSQGAQSFSAPRWLSLPFVIHWAQDADEIFTAPAFPARWEGGRYLWMSPAPALLAWIPRLWSWQEPPVHFGSSLWIASMSCPDAQPNK